MEKLDFNVTQEQSLVKELDQPSPKTPAKSTKLLPVLMIVALVLGSVSGVLLAMSRLSGSNASKTTQTTIPEDSSAIKVGTTYGSKDESNFPDMAEGVLVAGGVGGEGSHHLVRVGGASQNVYLSSSVVDLDTVVGSRVQVWGQTMSAKKAGWLMDVGRLKVLELNAPMPE